jgi:hypothetical protein
MHTNEEEEEEEEESKPLIKKQKSEFILFHPNQIPYEGILQPYHSLHP